MHRFIKPALFSLMLTPFLWLVFLLLTGRGGANPVELLQQETGTWSLRFLWLTLAMTPLTRWFRTPLPVRLRRMTGLYCLFYTVLHIFAWLVLDHQLSVPAITEDLLDRPFVAVGMIGFVILLMLGVTSPRRLKRRLGVRWSRLHRWVYAAALAAILHYIWLAKGERPEPLIYLGLLLVLLVPRLLWLIKSEAADA